MLEYRDYDFPRGAHSLAAYDGDELAGLVAWDEPEDRGDAATGVYVHMLWAAEGYRGQGIATELVRLLIASVPDRGYAETLHQSEHVLFTPAVREFVAKLKAEHPLKNTPRT